MHVTCTSEDSRSLQCAQPDQFTELQQQLLDDLSSSLSGSDAITARSNVTLLWSELWRQAGSRGSVASQLDRILQVRTTPGITLVLEVAL